ncbi:MAG TPA: hypothetical protein VLR49_01335 [Ferruginibacter sp.]|nr:hypothetical protein [Ferruginibacter sp.]
MKKGLIILWFLISILFSCTNKLYVADSEFEKKYLPFLIDKKSSREELIIKLGEPSWAFENGSILTYRISIDNKGNLLPLRIENNKNDQNISYTNPVYKKYYSLVLVFSENNILEKHSLLLTNP